MFFLSFLLVYVSGITEKVTDEFLWNFCYAQPWDKKQWIIFWADLDQVLVFFFPAIPPLYFCCLLHLGMDVRDTGAHAASYRQFSLAEVFTLWVFSVDIVLVHVLHVTMPLVNVLVNCCIQFAVSIESGGSFCKKV